MNKDIEKSVKLMLKSSNYHPYREPLTKKENFFFAIELAELYEMLAEDGQMDEAMNLPATHWKKVIKQLKRLLTYYE